ncbi:MAG TPA: cadherin-like domain-containing protein [Lacipirellulaceae bacterium]|nr:cadherin-like domain-containing protein [Lacipirellulaceae bacterium]
MSVQAFVARVVKAGKRTFRRLNPRRPASRRREARRRTFVQSLFRWDVPIDSIVPWRRVMLLECLESRALLTGNPTAYDQQYSGQHDAELSIYAPGVLYGASDPNQLPLTAVLETNPSHGTVSLQSDGSFLYTPATHWTGSDSFTYEAYDGTAYSNPATVTIDVTDMAPTPGDDSYGLTHDQTLTVSSGGGVLWNDRDPDGDAITASLATGPSHGTLSFDSDGSFVYTPDAHWVGSDSFTYEDYDGIAYSNPATVTLKWASDDYEPGCLGPHREHRRCHARRGLVHTG